MGCKVHSGLFKTIFLPKLNKRKFLGHQMAKIPRLNGVIAALEAGQPAFTTFSTPDVASAIANSTSTGYDGIVFEMEHNPWDAMVLRDCLQYMLNRGQIVKSGTLSPPVFGHT